MAFRLTHLLVQEYINGLKSLLPPGAELFLKKSFAHVKFQISDLRYWELDFWYLGFLKPLYISGVIHSDQRFIEALLFNDRVVIEEIYALYAGKVKRYITTNSGSEDDAADIFQEVLIEICRQAREKQLQLTCPFEPYLILLCKRKWLNELKKRGRGPVTKDIEDVSIGEDVFALAEQTAEQERRLQIFRACFGKLGAGCRELLEKTMSGEAQELIAAQLKVSYGYLRKKKSECMASLVKMIHSQLEGGQ